MGKTGRQFLDLMRHAVFSAPVRNLASGFTQAAHWSYDVHGESAY